MPCLILQSIFCKHFSCEQSKCSQDECSQTLAVHCLINQQRVILQATSNFLHSYTEYFPMIFIRSFIPVFFCILLHQHVHAQEKPGTSVNQIPDSLSLQSKDTDGDGVNDDEDKCINERGPASNFGCPIIISDPSPRDTVITRYIFFKIRSAELSPASVRIVAMVANTLNENPEYKVKLAGYKAPVGNYQYNMKLSAERAEAVKALLLAGGIDKSRIEFESYESGYPVETKETKSSQAKNRRVQIQIYYKR
jgi:outer membrane protein OmpA-like peptidoglycan-associated protein